MKTVKAKLKSMSPYSQSNYIREKKSRDETHAAFGRPSNLFLVVV